jgi:probable rRNA maturation factor
VAEAAALRDPALAGSKVRRGPASVRLSAKEMTEDRRRTIYLGPWRVDLVTRPGVDVRVSGASLARQVARALEASGAPEPGSVTVVLTDDEELADLNEAHMGHDGPTDVLSFPMVAPEAFPRPPRGTRPKPRGRRTHIGDIAISMERAAAQAEQGRGGQTGDVRWSPADELRLLVTHGSLHLCGWDHAEPADETEMRALEQELLA